MSNFKVGDIVTAFGLEGVVEKINKISTYPIAVDFKMEELAEASVNRNMYELHEADARVYQFKAGYQTAMSESNEFIKNYELTVDYKIKELGMENDELHTQLSTALDIINKMQAALEFYANPKSYTNLNAYEQSPKCILADKDCEVLFKEIPQKYAGLKARSTLTETSKLLEKLNK